MKTIKILKDCKWSIKYNAIDFKKGQECEVQNDVPFDIADKMVKCGHAEVMEAYCPKADKKAIVEENKAFDGAPENKALDGAPENKSVSPAEDSEAEEKPKKRGRPKK